MIPFFFFVTSSMLPLLSFACLFLNVYYLYTLEFLTIIASNRNRKSSISPTKTLDFSLRKRYKSIFFYLFWVVDHSFFMSDSDQALVSIRSYSSTWNGQLQYSKVTEILEG